MPIYYAKCPKCEMENYIQASSLSDKERCKTQYCYEKLQFQEIKTINKWQYCIALDIYEFLLMEGNLTEKEAEKLAEEKKTEIRKLLVENKLDYKGVIKEIFTDISDGLDIYPVIYPRLE